MTGDSAKPPEVIVKTLAAHLAEEDRMQNGISHPEADTELVERQRRWLVLAYLDEARCFDPSRCWTTIAERGKLCAEMLS